MGLDANEFAVKVEEFICGICLDVLEIPVSTPCGHTFCRQCLTESLESNASCPIDRKKLSHSDLVSVQVLTQLLDNLPVKCKFHGNGCNETFPRNRLNSHVTSCKYNPDVYTECEKGCAMTIKGSDRQHHDCIQLLKQVINSLTKRNKELVVENSLLCQIREENLMLKKMKQSNQQDCSKISKNENTELVHREQDTSSEGILDKIIAKESSASTALHIIAQKLSMTVQYKFTKSHVDDRRTVSLTYSVGSYSVEVTEESKRKARQSCAEKMFVHLKSLPLYKQLNQVEKSNSPDLNINHTVMLLSETGNMSSLLSDPAGSVFGSQQAAAHQTSYVCWYHLNYRNKPLKCFPRCTYFSDFCLQNKKSVP